jgi:hypothetical protein
MDIIPLYHVSGIFATIAFSGIAEECGAQSRQQQSSVLVKNLSVGIREAADAVYEHLFDVSFRRRPARGGRASS